MSPATLRHLTWSRVGVAVCVGLIAFGAVVALLPHHHHGRARRRCPFPEGQQDDRVANLPCPGAGGPADSRAVRHRLRHDRSGASRRATWPPRPLSLRGWCTPRRGGPAAWSTEDRRTTVALDPPGQPVAERGDTVAVIVTGIMTVTSDSGPPQLVPVAERIALHRSMTIARLAIVESLAGGSSTSRSGHDAHRAQDSGAPRRSMCVHPVCPGGRGLRSRHQQSLAARHGQHPRQSAGPVSTSVSSESVRGAVDTARRRGEDRIVLRCDRGLGCGCRGHVPVRAGDLRRVRQADSRRVVPCRPPRSTRPTPPMPRRATCARSGSPRTRPWRLVAYNCGNAGPACQAASAGYAEQVLATAASYTAPGAGVPSGVQAAVVSYAESQIGTPYVYGGDTPQTGFDCSGLVVWAYGLAGVVVPRVANDQWHDEPHVALSDAGPGRSRVLRQRRLRGPRRHLHREQRHGRCSLHRRRCPGRHLPRCRWGRLGRRRGRARCGRSGGHLMGSPRTCGCRGGVIVPLRPDVKLQIEADQRRPSPRDGRQSSERGPRCCPNSSASSTSLPSDEATATDPLRGPVHGAPLRTDVRGRRRIGRSKWGARWLLWVFGGHRLVSGGVGAGTGIFVRLLHHLADPALAWSPMDRASLPGPVALWASLLVTQLVFVGLVVVAIRLVRRFGAASGTLHGGPARASRAHVERAMGRRAVERHTAALYGKDAVAGARATGTRCGRRHRRPAVRQVRGLHPGGRRAPGRQGRGVRDPCRAPPQGSGGGDRHPP